MITTRTTFREVSTTGRKRFVCACGRKLTRNKKFYQTLNPFNKVKATGEIKTGEQIMVEIMAERKAWESVADRCTHAALKPCGAEFSLPSEDMNLDSVRCDLSKGHSGKHYRAPRKS